MGMDRISVIKDKWSVLEYARDVLKLAVRKSGDRCISLAPNSHNPTALIIYEDWWYDFKQGIGGDVIDLCAIAKYDGNKGEAIRELGGEVEEDWKSYTENLNSKIAYWHEHLRESDIEYLEKRRITRETVERLRIGYDEREDRIIIPYYKNGYVAYYCGRDRSGKAEASKYKKAKLDGLNENIPWGLHTLEPKRRVEVNKPEIEGILVITEGAFDAISFEQEGFKVLSPISGYFNKYALKQVLNIVKTVKTVFICFDNDGAGSRFQVEMCKNLFRNRVEFVCGHLPEGIKDVSEYYAGGGDLSELVKGAESGIQAMGRRITDKKEFEKFVYEAARYVKEPDLVELFEVVPQFSKVWLESVKKQALKVPAEKVIAQEILKKYELKYVENLGFYEYKRGMWESRYDNAIKGYISEAMCRFATGSKVESIIKLIKAERTTEEMFNKQEIFNFRNGVLELRTGKFMEHNAGFMSSIQVPYDYDEGAECPRWLKFIEEVTDNNEGRKRVLQEMAGYVLCSEKFLQKCFFLMGEGANGKSVLLNILREVFGEKNTSSVEMSGLSDHFQRITLMNSLLNVSTETNSNIKDAESVFKQIVVGDPIIGSYKNKDFVTFTPRCVMISACNEYIKSRDTSDGFMRRICFVKFPVTFKGAKADKDLPNKLRTELSGIFNWAYEGYKRLQEVKELTETEDQQELMKEFTELINPIMVFIEEELVGYKGLLERGELYLKYKKWCAEAGHEEQSRTKFMRNFKKMVEKLGLKVEEKKGGSHRYFEFGERFSEEAVPEWSKDSAQKNS